MGKKIKKNCNIPKDEVFEKKIKALELGSTMEKHGTVEKTMALYRKLRNWICLMEKKLILWKEIWYYSKL